MSSARPAPARRGRPGLLLLLLVSVGVTLAIGWFFRADYYVGRLQSATADADQADTQEHRDALRRVEDQLVQLGAPSRGRIYRALSDGSVASPSLDRALVRCAVRSYQAQPAGDHDELLGAITLALQRQPPGSVGLWHDLSGLELKLWSELACRVWPGLTRPERQVLLSTRAAPGAQLQCPTGE